MALSSCDCTLEICRSTAALKYPHHWRHTDACRAVADFCRISPHQMRNTCSINLLNFTKRRILKVMHLCFLTYAASAAFLICIGHAQSCLTDGSAASFPVVFGSIRREVEGYEELIDKFISPNFQFVSDSVAFLTGGTVNLSLENARHSSNFCSSTTRTRTAWKSISRATRTICHRQLQAD